MGEPAVGGGRSSSVLDAYVGYVKMTSAKITRLEASRRQLDQAIRLLFSRGDAVSIHTLSAAGVQILRDIADKKGITYLNKQIYQYIRPEKHKMLRAKFKEARDFFKHADQGPIEHEVSFSPDRNEFLLFEAVELYRALTRTTFPSAAAYGAWFFVKHQNLATGDVGTRARALVQGVDPNNFDDFIEFMNTLEKDSAATNGIINMPAPNPENERNSRV